MYHCIMVTMRTATAMHNFDFYKELILSSNNIKDILLDNLQRVYSKRSKIHINTPLFFFKQLDTLTNKLVGKILKKYF